MRTFAFGAMFTFLFGCTAAVEESGSGAEEIVFPVQHALTTVPAQGVYFGLSNPAMTVGTLGYGAFPYGEFQVQLANGRTQFTLDASGIAQYTSGAVSMLNSGQGIDSGTYDLRVVSIAIYLVNPDGSFTLLSPDPATQLYTAPANAAIHVLPIWQFDAPQVTYPIAANIIFYKMFLDPR
ncbi:MAG TPA: hypothetical protein VFQ60_00205 [Patescibacteria group bacterium]|nr:hypothetical protein [Patescibacteria group bacterium]